MKEQNILIAENIVKKIRSISTSFPDPVKVIESLDSPELEEILWFAMYPAGPQDQKWYPDEALFPVDLAFFHVGHHVSMGAHMDTRCMFHEFFGLFNNEARERLRNAVNKVYKESLAVEVSDIQDSILFNLLKLNSSCREKLIETKLLTETVKEKKFTKHLRESAISSLVKLKHDLHYPRAEEWEELAKEGNSTFVSCAVQALEFTNDFPNALHCLRFLDKWWGENGELEDLLIWEFSAPIQSILDCLTYFQKCEVIVVDSDGNQKCIKGLEFISREFKSWTPSVQKGFSELVRKYVFDTELIAEQARSWLLEERYLSSLLTAMNRDFEQKLFKIIS